MDENGDTPLMVASKLGHVKCVQTLISNGADVLHVNRTGLNALTMAALSGSVMTMSNLLKVTSMEHYMKMSLVPPLVAAIFGGHADAVDFLMQFHTPLSKTVTREGNSPLMLSIMFDRSDVTDLFSDEPGFLKNALGMTASDITEYKQTFMTRSSSD
ncbi:ankyrin repeat domain-containing protein 50 isoform X2 [Phlebotomus argentipes]|nr:ankyrin repeat domain-containing protein 50 isoform X2 [Phlebotomus argentipes]